MIDDEISLSDRYRQFLVTGIGRTIITRIFSLVYITIIANKVPTIIQDKMIILALSSDLIINLALFGVGYSLTQQSIIKKFSMNILNNVALSILVIGIPISLVIGIAVSIYLSLSFVQIVVYILSLGLTYLFHITLILNDCKIRTDLGLLTRAIYSIANSILVPTLFLIFYNLTSIIAAWNFALLVALTFNRKIILDLISSIKFDYNIALSVIKFGLPIYFVTIFTLAIQRLDTYLIFLFFEQGETTKYYWTIRISAISRELFLNLLAGLLPLFSKYYAKYSIGEFQQLTNNIVRISFFSAIIYYGGIIFQNKLVIIIILSEFFLPNSILLKIVLSGYIIGVIGSVLNSAAGAEGDRKIIVFGRITAAIFRLGGIVILFGLGALGLAIAIAFERIIVSFYYIISKRSYFHNFKHYSRLLIFFVIWMIVSWTFPTGIGFIQRIFYILMYIILLLISIYFSKPLTKGDFDLLKRVGGEKLKFIYPYLEKLLTKT